MKDPYVYENGVLINKLNIKDGQTLKAREAKITYAKLLNIENVEGRYDYDHLKKCTVIFSVMSILGQGKNEPFPLKNLKKF